MANLDPDKQREFAVDVVRQLREWGYEAYWAGGCVRDRLLGRKPKDYDVATTARPDEIRNVFGHRRTVAVGAAFGVIAVVGPRQAGQIDVATFREDAFYSDSRHPDSVTFSTPEADAQRRDFTINGLFFDPLESRVIDFVGGQQDLERGVVRAIGDPQARFDEDKLRLLRGVRFAAMFGFELEPETRAAIERLAGQITKVSAERIAAEMRLMLVDDHRRRAVELLRAVGLLEAVLPEVARGERPEHWRATLAALESLAAPTFAAALAVLVGLLIDAEETIALCRRWKLSNHETQRIAWLVENQNVLRHAQSMDWPTLQRMLIHPGIGELLALHEAFGQASGQSNVGLDYCRQKLAMPREQLDPPPLLTGDDLIALGIPRGKHYQDLLRAARDAQLLGEINTREEAIRLVEHLLGRSDDSADEET